MTPAAAKPSAGQPGCEPRKAETMQSESRTTRMREPLDQVIYRFASRDEPTRSSSVAAAKDRMNSARAAIRSAADGSCILPHGTDSFLQIR